MFDTFGEFDSAEEINKAAAGQLAQGDTQAIRDIARENGLDSADAEDYIAGDVTELCNPLKPYLLKSRNQSIIKFLSVIHKSTYEELVEQLQILKKVMIESMEEDNKVETTEKTKESDYDILVKKYGKK